MANEKRLIDANALEQHIADCFGYPAVDILHEIATFPTVDAAEVVRCKDCKSYCRIIGKGDRAIFGCSYMGRDVKPDDFCPYGERREGE